MKTELQTAGKILLIPPSLIVSNPLKPRIYYNEEALASLAASIAQYGLIEPLVVCYTRQERYVIVSGERRRKAAVMAGLKQIPCVLLTASKEMAAILTLTHHLRHADLNYFELANAIEKLNAFFEMSYQQISAALQLTTGEINDKIRLLSIPFALRKRMVENGLNEKFARLLLQHPDDDEKAYLVNEIIERRLTLSQTRALSMQLLHAQPLQKPKILTVYKDAAVFINSIDRILARLRDSGLKAELQRSESADAVTYRLCIPKSAAAEPVSQFADK